MSLSIGPLPEHLHDDAIALWHACGLTRPWNDPAADLRRALDGDTSEVLAAIDGTGLVGTAMVGDDGHRGWVYYVAVHPQRQGGGVGSMLMDAAENWLLERGCPKVMLMVRSSNAAVLDFYARRGYGDQSTAVLGKFFDPDLERLRAES